MQVTRLDDWNCSIARTLDVVGEWWTPLILRDAFRGTRRFDDFHASLGMARSVLTARLRKLTDQGILERHRYSEHPPRYEYRLTEKGLALFPVIAALMQWGDTWAAGPGGPPVVLVHDTCGHVTQPAPAPPFRAEVTLELFLDGRDADVQVGEYPPGTRSGVEREHAQQVLGADIAQAGPPREPGREPERLACLGRLRRRDITGQAATREQLAPGPAHRLGLHPEPFQD